MDNKKKQKNKISFTYGGFCDSLEDQAKKQGYTLGKNAKIYEKIKKNITYLRFALLLPDSMYDNLIKRLTKRIVQSIEVIPNKKKV